jgi:hypothetical protein
LPAPISGAPDLAVILAANTAGKQIEVLFDIDQLPPVLNERLRCACSRC